MKTKWLKMLAVVLSLVLAVPLFLTACSGGDDKGTKDSYEFVYDLNYEGAKSRTVQVKAGTRANRWKPTRSGYTFEDWYTEKECKKEFDFTKAINADTTVYAKWEKDAIKYNVTFNFGEGEDAAEVKVEENKTINETLLPGSPKLGYVVKNWYKDAEKTQKWDMGKDVVTSDITLYADFARDPSIPVDEDGNIKYENVKVQVYVGSDWDMSTVALKPLAEKFNEQYKGKIEVTIETSYNDGMAKNNTLRIQQNPGMNETYGNYYTVEEVFELAGIKYDADAWYTQAAQDSLIAGERYSIPLVAGVPHLVYNKTLMKKYAGTGNGDEVKLPKTYSELSALLKKAYAGESTTDKNFKSIMSDRSWAYKEGPSYAAFIQNSADYYVYENGDFVNKWTGTTMDDAVTAMKNTWDLFSEHGDVHGTAVSDNGMSESALNGVGEGNALMGMVQFTRCMADNGTKGKYTDDIGILPLSGLFTDKTGGQSQQIPVHTIGIQFQKGSDISLVELAAAGLFADYVSKNSVDCAKAGWYPLRKDVVESNAFQKSNDAVIKLMLQVGDPENFRTLDGFAGGKGIFNKTAAEGYIVPAFDNKEPDFKKIVEDLKASINGSLI